jgi:carbon-monoxide dehydrogenase large subunit
MSAALDASAGLSVLDRPNSYIGRSVPRPNLARHTQGRGQ